MVCILTNSEYSTLTDPPSGSIKKGNRKSEILLRDLEVRIPRICSICSGLNLEKIVATLASALQLKKYEYPKKRIDDMWEKVLLCQCKSYMVLLSFA